MYKPWDMCCFRCSGVLVEPDFSPSAHPDHLGLALGSAWSSQECWEPPPPPEPGILSAPWIQGCNPEWPCWLCPGGCPPASTTHPGPSYPVRTLGDDLDPGPGWLQRFWAPKLQPLGSMSPPETCHTAGGPQVRGPWGGGPGLPL